MSQGKTNRRRGAPLGNQNGKTHGHSARGKTTPTYNSWYSMHQRCYLLTHKAYRHYGAQGVSVWPDWNLFHNFLRDMGERPPGTTLDRVDSSGDYTPANCRWATAKQQNRNKGNVKLNYEKAEEIRMWCSIGYRQREVAAVYGVTQSTVSLVVRNKVWNDEQKSGENKQAQRVSL